MKRNRNYAGFYPRMLAHNIDLVILLPLCYSIGYFVDNNLTLFGLCGLLYIIYHTLFEMSSWRGTPGKKILKIVVIVESEVENLTFKQVLVRNVSKGLSALLFFAGFIMVFFDRKKRGLHDRMAGTVVIFVEI